MVDEPVVLLAQALDEQAHDHYVNIVKQDGAFLLQLLYVEQELDYERQYEQDVDIFEVAQSDCPTELQELGLRLLVPDAQSQWIDRLIPCLFYAENDLLLT